jgi:ribose transport system permease protein
MMNNKAIFILFFLVLIAASLSSNFFTSRNIFNVLRQVAAATVLGMGFSCVLGSGGMDLSVGFLLGLLGIISAKLTTATAFGAESFLSVFVIVLCVGLICGLFNGFLISFFGLPPFVVTLATGQIFKGINYIVSNTTAISGLRGGFAVIGQGYIGPIPVPVYISVFITVLISIVVYRTSFGRHIVAMGANREAARAPIRR